MPDTMLGTSHADEFSQCSFESGNIIAVLQARKLKLREVQ